MLIASLGSVGLAPPASAAPDAYRDLVAADGAVAYWSFDGACVAPCITNSDIGSLPIALSSVTGGILSDSTPGAGAANLTAGPNTVGLAQAPTDDFTIEAWIGDESQSFASVPLQGTAIAASGLSIDVEIVSEFPLARVLRFSAGAEVVAAVALERQPGYGAANAVHVAMTVEGSVVTAYLNGEGVGSLDVTVAGLSLPRESSMTIGGADLSSGPDGGGGLPPDDGGGGLPGPGGPGPGGPGGPGGDTTVTGVLDELAFYESALSSAQLEAHYRLIAPIGLEINVGAGTSAADVIATLVFTNYGPEPVVGFGDSGVGGSVGGSGLLRLVNPIADSLFDLVAIQPGESRTIQRLFDIDDSVPDATDYLISVQLFSPQQSFVESVEPVADPLGTGVVIGADEAKWFFPGDTRVATHPACLSNVSDNVGSFVVACWSDDDARQVYIDALIADGFEDGVDDVIWIGDYDEEPVRP